MCVAVLVKALLAHTAIARVLRHSIKMSLLIANSFSYKNAFIKASKGSGTTPCKGSSRAWIIFTLGKLPLRS